VADSEIELLKQAKFIATYILDPMCSADEINFQVGCWEFIKKVDAYILIKLVKNLEDYKLTDYSTILVNKDSLLHKCLTETMKVCENKINGSCKLHNLFCVYPNCEKD
jgi:hypothetical protein